MLATGVVFLLGTCIKINMCGVTVSQRDQYGNLDAQQNAEVHFELILLKVALGRSC
jgi:hypothetical protein